MSFLPILDYGVPPTATTSDGDGNFINSNPSGSDVSNTAATSSASAGGGNPPSRANPGGKGATASGEGGTAGAGGAKADGAEQPKKKATKAGSSGAGGKKAAGKAAAKAEGKAEGKKTGKRKAGTGKGTGKAAGTGASTSAAGAAAAAREKEERMKAARAEVEAHAAALEAHRSAVFKLQALLIRDELLDAAGVGKAGEVREWVEDVSMGERKEEEKEEGRTSVGMDGWVGGEQEDERGGMGVAVGDGGTIDVAAAAAAAAAAGEAGGAGGAGTGGNGPAATETARGKAEAGGARGKAAQAIGQAAELRSALKKAEHGEKGGRAVGTQREEERHVTWAADDRLAVAQAEGGRGRGEGEMNVGSAAQEERLGEGIVAEKRGGKEWGGVDGGKKQGAVRDGAVREGAVGEGSSGVVGRGEDGVEWREGWGVEGGAEAAATGRCGWFEPPPPGFMMQLPFHSTLLMALQEWVTADSLCLIYPPRPPAPQQPAAQQSQQPAQPAQPSQPQESQQPAPQQSPCVESSLEANGWEYPALLGSVNDPTRASEIRRTLGEGLGRETAGVVEGLGLLLPLSTVEHALTRLLATFAFRSPLASLRRPHWQLLLLLLLEALSVNCLPPAASDALNTHRHQVYKVAAAAGVDRDNYLLLRQMLLPRGPSVSNPNQNTNAAA
ncbi:unnamed protein product [Closterium sp. Naga37s-1]|nr:unnamed protein product [Closterium sp. Naga37s-1]